jgi:hypothetical protein
MMETFRIVPRNGVYTIEAFEPGGPIRIVSTWRSEAAAVVQLRDLQAKAEHAEQQPIQDTLGWRPGARDTTPPRQGRFTVRRRAY